MIFLDSLFCYMATFYLYFDSILAIIIPPNWRSKDLLHEAITSYNSMQQKDALLHATFLQHPISSPSPKTNTKNWHLAKYLYNNG